MQNEHLHNDLDSELVTSFTIEEVERRLEMTFYCCQGGDFGYSTTDDGMCCYTESSDAQA